MITVFCAVYIGAWALYATTGAALAWIDRRRGR